MRSARFIQLLLPNMERHKSGQWFDMLGEYSRPPVDNLNGGLGRGFEPCQQQVYPVLGRRCKTDGVWILLRPPTGTNYKYETTDYQREGLTRLKHLLAGNRACGSNRIGQIIMGRCWLTNYSCLRCDTPVERRAAAHLRDLGVYTGIIKLTSRDPAGSGPKACKPDPLQ